MNIDEIRIILKKSIKQKELEGKILTNHGTVLNNRNFCLIGSLLTENWTPNSGDYCSVAAKILGITTEQVNSIEAGFMWGYRVRARDEFMVLGWEFHIPWGIK